MRNSVKYKYSKGKNANNRNSASKPPGKSNPWIEVKFSGDTDMKATNPLIHKRVSKGIVGKINLKQVADQY